MPKQCSAQSGCGGGTGFGANGSRGAEASPAVLHMTTVNPSDPCAGIAQAGTMTRESVSNNSAVATPSLDQRRNTVSTPGF